jgi:hypothetical protein
MRGLPMRRPAPDNGMHSTANSAAFIRETRCLMRCARRVMPGGGRLPEIYEGDSVGA